MLINKLSKQVESLKLNLKGKVVLTEAATGAYIVTPILAALAGAKVYAYTKSTSYGSVSEVIRQTKQVYEDFDEAQLDITFIEKLTPELIYEADIITNSGHLRPLNKEKLQHAKDGLVIPLMYEAWEWRDADMDINYIKRRGFKVGATNERHPDVDVFNFLGDMAIKQIFDAGLCLFKNKFILICNNDFGPYIAKVISKMCDGLCVIDTDENKHKYDLQNIDWVGGFPHINIPEKYKDAEAVLFTAYPFVNTWIGKNGEPIKVKSFQDALTNPFILRYAGEIDTQAFKEAGISYFPKHVPIGHMGILPSAIGYDPTIRLQAGGLKVAEAMLTDNYSFKNMPIGELI
ncbi:MAG: hypothetical protein JWN56_299 [Sphingobacteriales bacterium]|nr:hypothetical protein [Sphingobacteriales bacterium]